MLLYIGGVRRSASTLAFQMATELVGEPNRIRRWQDRPNYVLGNNKSWFTTKGHGYVGELEKDAANGLVEVFATIRDPRDIVVSIMQLYGYPDGEKSSVEAVLGRGWLQHDIAAQRKWRKNFPDHYTAIRYEDFYQSIHLLPMLMGMLMQATVSLDRALELGEKFSYLNNRERSKEQGTIAADMLFPNHVQTGMVDMWMYMLSTSEIMMIQEEIGEDWFNENGYKLWKG